MDFLIFLSSNTDLIQCTPIVVSESEVEVDDADVQSEQGTPVPESTAQDVDSDPGSDVDEDVVK